GDYVPVAAVTLDQDDLTLAMGDYATLTATVAPTNVSLDSVVWRSADPAIATVDDRGLVFGLEAGTTTVTAEAYDNGVSATAQVTVTPPAVRVASLTLDPDSLTLQIGDTSRLNVSLNPANASLDSVTWASSDPAVASVNATGQVVGLVEGTAVLTARSFDGGFTDTTFVTVARVSTADAGAAMGLKVYPNPFGNTLTLTQLNGAAAVRLYTLTGRRLIEETVRGEVHTLDTRRVAAGTYLLEVTWRDGRTFRSRYVRR
ncbi:MAG: Ig-like domain-containing protein, partial [Catalinimonas sp.]